MTNVDHQHKEKQQVAYMISWPKRDATKRLRSSLQGRRRDYPDWLWAVTSRRNGNAPLAGAITVKFVSTETLSPTRRNLAAQVGPVSPHMSPLAVGIDHVSMNISYSQRGSEAGGIVLHLAKRHGLVIYDPQGDEVTGLCQDYEVPMGPGS
jgi:hypothetical protein